MYVSHRLSYLKNEERYRQAVFCNRFLGSFDRRACYLFFETRLRADSAAEFRHFTVAQRENKAVVPRGNKLKGWNLAESVNGGPASSVPSLSRFRGSGAKYGVRIGPDTGDFAYLRRYLENKGLKFIASGNIWYTWPGEAKVHWDRLRSGSNGRIEAIQPLLNEGRSQSIENW